MVFLQRQARRESTAATDELIWACLVIHKKRKDE